MPSKKRQEFGREPFHALLDALPDAVLVIEGGTVVYGNAAMVQLLGHRAGHPLAGLRFANLVDANGEDVLATIEALAIGGHASRLHVSWRRPLEGAVMTDCAVGRVQRDGRWAIQIVARDITERLSDDAEVRRASAVMAQRIADGRVKLRESRRRLGSETLRRQRAEGDRDELLARVALTAENERARLSRELHDEVGQHLTGLLLGLQGIIDVAGVGSEVDERARALHGLAQRLGADLHDVAVRLRPKALDDFGIDAALESYAALWSRQTGISTNLRTTGQRGRLPDLVETALYRIAQEALTNVARHSEAKSVSVLLHKEDHLCRLAIEDDGKGFDPLAAEKLDVDRAGLGLIGIRERARLVGGEVDIESQPLHGASVCVRIPVGVTVMLRAQGAPA